MGTFLLTSVVRLTIGASNCFFFLSFLLYTLLICAWCVRSTACKCDRKCETNGAWNAGELDDHPDPLLASVHPPLVAVQRLTLPSSVFSEGLTVLNGQLFVATYQSRAVFVLDLQLRNGGGGGSAAGSEGASWSIIEQLTLPPQIPGAWGLSSVDLDGSDELPPARKPQRRTAPAAAGGKGSAIRAEEDDVLIVSDGSDQLHVVTPRFEFVQTVRVIWPEEEGGAAHDARNVRLRTRNRPSPSVASASHKPTDPSKDEFASIEALSFSSVASGAASAGAGAGAGAGGMSSGGGDPNARFQLNELEFVDGQIWANAFGTDCILRIALVPAARNHTSTSGSASAPSPVVYEPRARVVGIVVAPPNFYTGQYKAVNVMNGIAYDSLAHRLFVCCQLSTTSFAARCLSRAHTALQTLMFRVVCDVMTGDRQVLAVHLRNRAHPRSRR